MDERPPRLPFELQPGEDIVLLLRRHWFHLYPKLALMVFAAFTPPAFVLVLVARTAGLSGVVGLVTWTVSGVWLLYWLVRMYFTWYRYEHDLWVITNQRVIDSYKKHWFSHRMASADLIDVEDISVSREGVLATSLNFGDVRLQTAGQIANFTLRGIPNPSSTLGSIDRARDAARRDISRPAH